MDKVFGFFLWTILVACFTALIGSAITEDRTMTGTLLQFETGRTVILDTPATLSASRLASPFYLYKEGTTEIIVPLPEGSAKKASNMAFVYKPATVPAGKWLNPSGYQVNYTITSDTPVKVTLAEGDPGVTWFLTILVAIFIWFIVILIVA